jgi:hypothetical protein
MNNLFSFETLDRALNQAGSYIGAAEIHGLQSGMICGEKIANAFNWEEALIHELSGVRPNADLLKQLNYLYMHTSYQLQGFGFGFDLLLPNEHTNLNKRAKALADWCRGFLCGLGLAGIQDNIITSKMTKESIKDLSQIAYIEAGDDELLEEQEKAFFELTEYVKIAVQTIQVELKAGKSNTTTEYVFH